MREEKPLSTAAKILTGLAVTAALLLAVFFAGRYGWRLLGFRACQGAVIQSIEVTEGQVEITGCSPGSFPEGFLGYYAEEEDGTLYAGFCFSSLFGFFETGSFHITIPTKGGIREVYLKTEKNEFLIWSIEEENP